MHTMIQSTSITNCTTINSVEQSNNKISKALLAQEIYQAFTNGNLYLRSVVPTQEKIYLKQQQKAPRPCYLIAPNIPIKMRDNSSNLVNVGIIGAKTLFSYKQNASTDMIVNGGGPDIRIGEKYYKCLADSNSLLNKLHELASRKWEVYPLATSGHLQADGSFSLPKFKNYKLNPSYIMPHSEEVKSAYNLEQIKCYCVNQKSGNKITNILANKKQLEQELNIGSLPIVLYSENNGTIKVIFEEDINIDLIKENENKLESLHQIFGIDVNHKIAYMLPLMSRIIEYNNHIDVDTSDIQNLPKTIKINQELVNLITNYYKYSLADLQNLLQQGANAKLELHFYANEYYSLADKLLFAIFDNSAKSSEIAAEMLNELFIQGNRVSSNLSIIIRFKDYDKIVNTCVASYILLNNINLNSIPPLHLLQGYRHGIAGTTFLLDKRLKTLSNVTAKDLFIDFFKDSILDKEHINSKNASLEYFYPQFKILFIYGVNPTLITQADINDLNNYQKTYIILYTQLHKDKKIEELLQEITNLWHQHKIDTLRLNWLNEVKQAEEQLTPFINKLKTQVSNTTIKKSSYEVDKTLLPKLCDSLFANKLILETVTNSDETIVNILQHYYRRPGANQALNNINMAANIELWKPIHSSSHVLRAYNNATWYMELLEKFNLAIFTNEEKLLLQLAVIYHDAAAEDVSKQAEEQQSSYYLKRDLAGKFSSDLLENIALALEAKEDDILGKESEDTISTLAKYKMVIRFADRMDFIRCSKINSKFPNLSHTDNISTGEFNSALLNLPETETAKFTDISQQQTLFQQNLEAAMHGATDLAAVAGGYNDKEDLREKGSYEQRYGLTINNQLIKISFERTDTSITQLTELIDNNVRRKIANLAGINTCNDPSHQACQADTSKGIIRGIHSTYNDLMQITVPESMTLLEKMQFEHNMMLLSEEALHAINAEVTRLKQEGLQMSLGTLTQDVLNSEPAKLTLNIKNIKVITEQRSRGFNSNDEQVYQQILVIAES